jgi:hypothetical protein
MKYQHMKFCKILGELILKKNPEVRDSVIQKFA